MKLTAIAAVAANGTIGSGGGMVWNIPEDFARFKRVTMGQILIMGRVTFDSIGKALPGRTCIVISRSDRPADAGAPKPAKDGTPTRLEWVHSLEEALQLAQEIQSTPVEEQPDSQPQIFIAGGAHVYAEAWDRLTDLDITEIHADYDGDAHFPKIDPADWTETSRNPRNGFDFVTYTRKKH
jgi:dihydrofolate reductase